MFLASLIFSGWDRLWLAAGAMTVAILLLIWSYRVATAGMVRWLCLGLKLLGLAALALCLLEPLWSGQRARPGANLIAVVADNSQGLQIKDRGETRSRGELLREVLDPQRTSWQERLEENFEVRRYFFDARLQTTKDFSELAFDGRASGIGATLRTLAERYRNRPLAGVLLLTDGNATDLRGAPDLAGLPPVYPVIIGQHEPARDIAVHQAHVSQTDFEDAPVSVQADVTSAGYGGESIVAQLFDTSGKKVEEKSLRARKDVETLAFRFQFRPEKTGLSFYRLRVGARNEVETPGAQNGSKEATLINNNHVLVVDRGRGPYRILYVAGRPNWEFKFLNRAVQEDTQLRLVGLIRVAKREPKFNFLGRAGETSNPLFRGFGNQSPEDIERYDQPVLVRMYPDEETKSLSETALRTGFPRNPEDLYGYHAVILDDVEAEFFMPEQAALLQKFVSERGGGFLMLGGMESFQQGKYQRTPIGDMLPVYLDRMEEDKTPDPLHLDLTREGLLQPWARLRDNETDEKIRLQGMVPFQVVNRVREVKPGASIIATVADAAGKTNVALVVQRFGRGRTAALTIGDLWRWGMHDAASHQDMDKSWRQLMRWLVTDVPNQVDLTVEPQSEDATGAVRLQVRVRDPKFQPLDNAGVTLEIQPLMVEGTAGASTNLIRLQTEASLNEAGLYQATYVPRATGGYKATTSVTNAVGAEVGRAEAGWSTDLAVEEFRSLTPNVALLESIAKKTGGEIISPDRLDEFVRNLPNKHAPVMDSWNFPLWHTPAMFAFALACLLGEWGLRRWKGMP
jgi:uncharacterized membrane protein